VEGKSKSYEKRKIRALGGSHKRPRCDRSRGITDQALAGINPPKEGGPKKKGRGGRGERAVRREKDLYRGRLIRPEWRFSPGTETGY